MARMMSVRFTEDAVRERRKTVTRRKGWWRKDNSPLVTPGTELRLVRQAMGLRKGDTVVELARVRVVSVAREPLRLILPTAMTRLPPNDDQMYTLDAYGKLEMVREGFPGMDPLEFIETYFTPQRVALDDMVTRIEWEYLPDTQEQT